LFPCCCRELIATCSMHRHRGACFVHSEKWHVRDDATRHWRDFDTCYLKPSRVAGSKKCFFVSCHINLILSLKRAHQKEKYCWNERGTSNQANVIILRPDWRITNWHRCFVTLQALILSQTLYLALLSLHWTTSLQIFSWNKSILGCFTNAMNTGPTGTKHICATRIANCLLARAVKVSLKVSS
jgi:hypothetical protein